MSPGQGTWPPLPRRLSPRAIADYRICPRRVWYRYIAKVPERERPNPSLMLGNAVHAALGIRKFRTTAEEPPHWTDFWWYGVTPTVLYAGLGATAVALWARPACGVADGWEWLRARTRSCSRKPDRILPSHWHSRDYDARHGEGR